jgi:2',3'-cyclic-nucleotide 2'-phosphodiesterase (5'-nucleotidase family)
MDGKVECVAAGAGRLFAAGRHFHSHYERALSVRKVALRWRGERMGEVLRDNCDCDRVLREECGQLRAEYHVGVLEIEVVDGKIESYSGELVAMDAAVPDSAPDSVIEAIIGKYNQALEEKMAVVVGHTEVALDGERAHVRTGTTNLANLVTDAMRGASGADIVITNGGGIRASIPAGDITMGSIYTVLPFDNSLVVIELSGKDLLAALEHGIGNYPSQAGSFAQVSGLTFTFDPSKPAGSRILEVLVAGEPLEADRLYAVATNDFMAAGGDGYVWFAEANILFDSGEMLRDVVAGYLSEQESVEASSEIRIVSVQ